MLMRCRSEDKAKLLEQIGREIAEDTRFILVNISNGEDISVTQQRHSQGENEKIL